MELQGYVVVALTLILFGYLLPHLVRSRQVLLDSRVEDRFSGDLRIVATGAEPRDRQRRHQAHSKESRPHLHTARPIRTARRPEATMTPPRAGDTRVSDDARALAAARAARAARLSRRAAAARRRLVLTIVLLLATAAAWAAVALMNLLWVAALVPSILLVTVLALGRRTAVRARANDRRDRAEMARFEAQLKSVSRRAQAARQRPGATHSGPATASHDDVRPAGGTAAAAEATATDPDVSAEPDMSIGRDVPAEPDAAADPMGDTRHSGDAAPAGVDRAAEAAPSRSADRAWTPVPVPAPSYTLKPSAPRRDVEPYAAAEAPSAAVPQRPSAPSSGESAAEAPDEPPAPALDLDAVLARRRAAGA